MKSMDKASLHPAEGFGTAPIKAEGMMVDYDSGLSWDPWLNDFRVFYAGVRKPLFFKRRHERLMLTAWSAALGMCARRDRG